MGRMHEQEYRELLGKREGLKAHLETNFYPPLPLYVKVSIIDGFQEYWDGKIGIKELPKKCYLRSMEGLYMYFDLFLNDDDR